MPRLCLGLGLIYDFLPRLIFQSLKPKGFLGDDRVSIVTQIGLVNIAGITDYIVADSIPSNEDLVLGTGLGNNPAGGGDGQH